MEHRSTDTRELLCGCRCRRLLAAAAIALMHGSNSGHWHDHLSVTRHRSERKALCRSAKPVKAAKGSARLLTGHAAYVEMFEERSCRQQEQRAPFEQEPSAAERPAAQGTLCRCSKRTLKSTIALTKVERSVPQKTRALSQLWCAAACSCSGGPLFPFSDPQHSRVSSFNRSSPPLRQQLRCLPASAHFGSLPAARQSVPGLTTSNLQ